MRIRTVHINTQRQWGGGERQTLLLLRGLLAHDHEVILATRPESPLGTRAREAGIRIHALRPINEIDPRSIASLIALLRSERPDVLHMHSSHALSLGGIASLFARCPVRVVSRRMSKSIYRRHTLRLNWIKYRFGADHSIAISNAVKRRLVDDGIDSSRISVVYSGIDVDRVLRGANGVSSNGDGAIPPGDAESGASPPPARPRVVSVGTLARAKGTDDLLRAARVVLDAADAEFVIVGDGPDRRRFEALARELDIQSHVRFTGFRDDALRLLASATVFVQPSRTEGLGTSLFDALVLERPIVACSTGGIPEIIAHGENGLLVPPGDETALADAILRLLGDEALRRSLARSGRRRVLDGFTGEQMVEGTLAVYRLLLEKS